MKGTVLSRQTAHDIFTQCLITDWIDHPAHSRPAELRGQASHRAGLLEGPVLRDLLERRHQLADGLNGPKPDTVAATLRA